MRAELLTVTAGAVPAPVEYSVAAGRFLEQAWLSPASRRVYRISLASWAWPLVGLEAPRGSERRGARPPLVPLALLDDPAAPARLAAALARRAGRADARTVNREVSALRSAVYWWVDQGWIAADPTTGLRHRVGRAGAAPALSDQQAAAVFALPAGLREQALWRVLRASGSPAERVLALDAGTLDLAARRSRRTAAGPPVCWDGPSSRLLGWLQAGRSCGPLFLTDRRAPAGTLPADVCPVTGRARMSYRRAAEIFTGRTRELDPAGHGWRLHQLRRPAPADSR
ncbi:MAG TPA: site-specific recombinase [Streptosporangiaceae bacterium]|nr:site-specific recombinase [Streptosporangiaceae bacterium]